MYDKLVDYHSKIDSTMDPRSVGSCKIVEHNGNNPEEVNSFMEHLVRMGELRVKHDKVGILQVEKTSLRVEQNYGGNTFIISKYGKLKVPVFVRHVR